MLKEHLGFFTRVNLASHASLKSLAGSQHYFPVVGLVIGVLMSVIFSTLGFLGLPSAVSGAVLVAFLYLLTGIIHVDGLADFADGLAASGERKDRIDAMQDPVVGAAGAVTVLIVLLLLHSLLAGLFETGAGTVFLLEFFGSGNLFFLVPAVVAAEVSAKLGMNTAVFFSRPVRVSSAEVFMERIDLKSYVMSVMIAGLILAFLGPLLLLAGLVAQAVPLYLVRVSDNVFGGGFGDMVGASNELTRVAALLLVFLF